MTAVSVRCTTVEVEMADGCRLATDVWAPSDGGSYPTLLQRLPYGRKVASSVVLPSPAALARLGYSVVIQDVRGTGDSAGTFTPFADTTDGVRTVEWAADQEFSTGRVCLYGFSYQGHNQLQVAARRPAGLAGIAPLMTPGSPYAFLHENGLLRWDFVTLWAAQLAGLAGDQGRTPDPAAMPLTAGIGQDPPEWFTHWIQEPPVSGYWTEATADLTAIEVPVFTVLGYADVFASGSDDLARALGARIVCGPWEHMPWGTRFGDLELGADAGPAPAHAGLLAFFDEVLRDLPNSTPPARWYEIGGSWRSATCWPPPSHEMTWFATSTQGANSRNGDGVLATTPAVITAAASGTAAILDELIAEPLVPVPGDSGPYPDVSAVEDRRDVLCYTSAALEHPLHLAGRPEIEVTLVSSAPSTDLAATFCVVEADRSRQFAIGADRIDLVPGEPTRLRLALSPIGLRVAPGQSLRLDLSASRFPRYDRNPQSPGEPTVAVLSITALSLTLPVLQDTP